MKNNFSRAIESSFAGRSESSHLEKDKREDNVSNKTAEKEDTISSNIAALKKHPGGRKTNASKGLQKRKKYSLTLLPETYEETLHLANAEGISFSVYVQRALSEYKKSH